MYTTMHDKVQQYSYSQLGFQWYHKTIYNPLIFYFNLEVKVEGHAFPSKALSLRTIDTLPPPGHPFL